jgi:DUF2934 family protein
MSSSATVPQQYSQHNLRILPENEHHAFHDALRQTIAERAYHLFLEHGGNTGDDASNWYQAEGEILQPVDDVRQDGAWCAANAAIGDSDPQALQVIVLDHRAIVSGIQPAEGQHGSHLLIRWPSRVDPATAAAYTKGAQLTITAKHAPQDPATQPSAELVQKHGVE